MTRDLTLRPQAEMDISEIWDFTAKQWSLGQAQDYFAGLSGIFDLLCAHPEIARERKEFTPPVRIHPFRSHVIIFAANDHAVEILRVVHSRTNWTDLLSE